MPLRESRSSTVPTLGVAALALVAVLLVALVAAPARAATFSQGFEVDTSGWFDFSGSGTANREADGYVSPVPYASGVSSSEGTHHARLRRGNCGLEGTGGGPATRCFGPFTEWGGENKVWTGGYTTQVDVYFDVAYAIANPDPPLGNTGCLPGSPSNNTACKGTRFDFTSAINKSDGSFLRDFVFNVGTGPGQCVGGGNALAQCHVNSECPGGSCNAICPGGNGFVIAASTNAFRSGASPYNPGKSPYCISTSGWYTLRHTFKDVGGLLVVDMDLLQGNAVVNSWSVTANDAIATVGCNAYGWFANQEIWDLAIDKTQMQGCGVEVTQCMLDGWEIANFDNSLGMDIGDATTASGTDGNFVSGPGTPPLGSGSFQEVVGTDGDDATRIRTSNCNGTLLTDVASLPLTYWTYVTSFGSGGQATYIQLRVDQDGDGTTDDILFFEPVYQNGTYSMITGPNVPNQCDGNPGCVLLNTWQFWDGQIGGWWSNNESAGGPPLITLADYAAEHPNVKLATDFPSLRLTAGFGAGAWSGFNGATDDLTACGTTYNFELGPCPTATPPATATATPTPTTTPTPTATATPHFLDPFSCFESEGRPISITGVTVSDTFNSGTVTLKKRKRLCNPADLNGADPAAPTRPDHLLGYILKPTSTFNQVPNVTVTNVFGNFTMTVVKPNLLLVPMAKSLNSPAPPAPVNPPLNHYLCYKIRGPKFSGTATFSDQFVTAEGIDVKKPLRLCAPVDKNGEGIFDPASYLMCFKMRPQAPFRGPDDPVFVADQFGTDSFVVNHPRELCVPSSRL